MPGVHKLPTLMTLLCLERATRLKLCAISAVTLFSYQLADDFTVNRAERWVVVAGFRARQSTFERECVTAAVYSLRVFPLSTTWHLLSSEVMELSAK